MDLRQVDRSALLGCMRAEFGACPEWPTSKETRRGWGLGDAIAGLQLPQDQARWLAMELAVPLAKITSYGEDDPLFNVLAIGDPQTQVRWELTRRLRIALSAQVDAHPDFAAWLVAWLNPQLPPESAIHVSELAAYLLDQSGPALCDLLERAAVRLDPRAHPDVACGLYRLAQRIFAWVMPERDAIEARIREARAANRRLIKTGTGYENDTEAGMAQADGQWPDLTPGGDQAGTLIHSQFDVTPNRSRLGLGANAGTQAVWDMAVAAMTLSRQGDFMENVDFLRALVGSADIDRIGSAHQLAEADKPRKVIRHWQKRARRMEAGRHTYARSSDWGSLHAGLQNALLQLIPELELVEVEAHADPNTTDLMDDLMFVINKTRGSCPDA